jgi:hypothetical protein
MRAAAADRLTPTSTPTTHWSRSSLRALHRTPASIALYADLRPRLDPRAARLPNERVATPRPVDFSANPGGEPDTPNRVRLSIDSWIDPSALRGGVRRCGHRVCPDPAAHLLLPDRELDSTGKVVPNHDYTLDPDRRGAETHPRAALLGLRVPCDRQLCSSDLGVAEGLKWPVLRDALEDAVVHQPVVVVGIPFAGSHDPDIPSSGHARTIPIFVFLFYSR